MSLPKYKIVVIPDRPVTLDALAHRAGVHPRFIEQLVDLGLILPAGREGATLMFDPSCLPRLRMIGRMRKTLGINLAGISVILDLLDRMYALQRDYESLRGRI